MLLTLQKTIFPKKFESCRDIEHIFKNFFACTYPQNFFSNKINSTTVWNITLNYSYRVRGVNLYTFISMECKDFLHASGRLLDVKNSHTLINIHCVQKVFSCPITYHVCNKWKPNASYFRRYHLIRSLKNYYITQI